MKKIISLFFVFALLLAPKAFAYNCEQSQAFGGSDACWTEVQFSPSVTVGVSAGTVLVYDYTSGQKTYQATQSDPTSAYAQAGSWYVIPATVSADNHRVAGVLQASIDATRIGNPTKILVRGFGDVNVHGTITSGDPLFVAIADANSTKGTLANGPLTSGYSTIGMALETSSTNTKKKAYIRIV
jgi:hypothetical protein